MRQATNTIKKENFLFHPSASSVRMDGEEKRNSFFSLHTIYTTEKWGKMSSRIDFPIPHGYFFSLLVGLCRMGGKSTEWAKKYFHIFLLFHAHEGILGAFFFFNHSSRIFFCFHSLLAIRKYESSSWKCSFSCGSEYIQTEKSVAA